MNNKTIRDMMSILYLFGSLVLALNVQAASFDCVKAASKIEKLICRNDELSKLDEMLSKTYRQVLELSDDKQKATKEQRQWLKDVRNACQDVGCMKTTYQERINKLGMVVGQAQAPAKGSNNGNATQTQTAIPPKQPMSQKTSLCIPETICDKVILMYSEDDSICKPLLKVYQQLWDKQKEHRSWHDAYWEDHSPEVFVKAEFVPPSPLRDAQHRYIPIANNTAGELPMAFYKLRLDPNVPEQIVLLRDFPYATHGGYSSNVYISKPGEDISTSCSQDFFSKDAAMPGVSNGGCGNQAAHNQLAFATDFRWDFDDTDVINAETLISHEYYFEKDDTDEKFSIVMHGKVVPIALGIGKSTIQRVYLFRNQPIFTARVSGNAVVYRIKNGSQMDDVCYFASNVVRNTH